ncbi:glycoside hydrolase domain-containing protein [Ureibacillus composti]
MVSVHWGVDSSQSVTQELYNCVMENYGKPEYWGRYLTRVEGASEGLTKDEISLLHRNGTKLMPIYNDFRRAIGESNGRIAAMNATYYAQRLGIQKGSFIFANIENFMEVDSSWIKGFVNYLYNSDYKPGFYHDPTEGGFNSAFCQAVSEEHRVQTQAILWSAKEDPGVTKAKDAPQFNPLTVDCQSNTWAWQYGRDSEVCPIDTNLIDRRLFDQLH